jgi:ABC-type nitrate/sulfonate/bicarbonate transport system permease component
MPANGGESLGWARQLALGLLGVVLLVAAWEAVGRLDLFGGLVPSASEVASSMSENWDLLLRGLTATATAAAWGFVIGMAVGLGLALVGVLMPPLAPGVGRLATLVNSIPWVTLGPIIVIVVSQSMAPTVIAALAVFFSSYVAISSGFGFALRTHHEVFSVLGASRFTRFRRLQLPAAVPAILDGAKLGAPAALLGAVFGEWFGSTRGLGVLILTSLQLHLPERLWAAALLTALLAMALFAAFSVAQRAAEVRYR